MYLDDLIPVADSKRVNQVVRKIFGYNINLESLNVNKAKSLKENFTKQLKTLETKLGARCESNQTYLQLKLVNEVLDKHIVENDMSDEAHELVLFGENDADLYRQRTVPIMKNLTKKWDKGVYDHELAVKLWTYWAADAAQRYSAEHGSPDVKWSNMFPTSVRNEVAEYMADYWEEELEAGNKMESVQTVEESVILEGEIETAEVVMAAKNVVDRIQGMIEDLGEILNEDLPPLTDTIRDQMDSTQAQSYYDSVSSAIMSALEAMRVSREAADSAARSIAGEQGAETMGAEPEVPEVPVEEPADDEFGASAAAAGGEEPMGRAEQV